MKSRIHLSLIGFGMMALTAWPAVGVSHESIIAKGVSDAVIDRILQRFPDQRIKEVRRTPFEGLYEVMVGSRIVYLSPDNDHLIIGKIYNPFTDTDLTKVRYQEINAQNKARTLASNDSFQWSTIPEESVIRTGTDGGVKVAVITDPTCGYCRKLKQEMHKVDGIEFHEILYPRSGPDSQGMRLVEAIWCSTDQEKALDDVFIKGRTPQQNNACDTAPLKKGIEFVNRIGMQGTPMLIREDGNVMMGYASANELLVWANAARN